MDELIQQERNYYNKDDILREAETIFSKHNLNLNETFQVADSLDEFINVVDKINKKTNLDLNTQPFVIILNLKASNTPPNWTTLIMFKIENELKVFFKDSLGVKIEVGVKNVIMSKLGVSDENILSHHTQEQEDACTSGELALKNVDIFLDDFKKDKKDLVENYHRVKFARQSDIDTSKSYCPEIVNKRYESKLDSDLVEKKIDQIDEGHELVQIVIQPQKIQKFKLSESNDHIELIATKNEMNHEKKKVHFEDTKQDTSNEKIEKESTRIENEEKSFVSNHTEIIESKISSNNYATTSKETQTYESRLKSEENSDNKGKHLKFSVSVAVDIPIEYETRKKKLLMNQQAFNNLVEIPVKHETSKSNDKRVQLRTNLKEKEVDKRRSLFIEKTCNNDTRDNNVKRHQLVRLDSLENLFNKRDQNNIQERIQLEDMQSYLMNDLQRTRQDFEKRHSMWRKQFEDRFKMFKLDSRFNELERGNVRLSVGGFSDDDDERTVSSCPSSTSDFNFNMRSPNVFDKNLYSVRRKSNNDLNNSFEEYNYSHFNYSTRYVS